MNIFRIIVIIILSIEALGTFIASCTGSEDCKTADAIVLLIALLYVIIK